MYAIMMAAALVLAAVTIVFPLAGAQDAPGDLRLSAKRYFAVRGAYYPGFTIAGIAEPLSVLVLGALLATVSRATPLFWLVALAFALEALAHVVYWALIAPLNGVWLSGKSNPWWAGSETGLSVAELDQRALQIRWERRHVCRAVISTAAFIFLIAATLFGPIQSL